MSKWRQAEAYSYESGRKGRRKAPGKLPGKCPREKVDVPWSPEICMTH